MIPGICLVSFFLEVGYPLWCTYNALYKTQGVEDREAAYGKWTIYWVAYTLCSWLHSTLLHYITDWIPLFSEMKCVATFWLISDDFNGIVWLWETYLRAAFLTIDDQVTQFNQAKLQGLMNFALESPSGARKAGGGKVSTPATAADKADDTTAEGVATH